MVNPILNIISKFIPDPDKKLELEKAVLENKEKIEEAFKEYSKQDYNLRIKEIEHKGFKASWRPYIMFSLSTVMVLYLITYYIIPQYITLFNINTYYLEPIEMPTIIWQVFAFCIVGVSGLRTIDKWRQK